MELENALTRPVPQTLEEILKELCYFGKPRLSYQGDGWFAKIEMFVSSEGASFDVQSGFDHTTPIEAATVLYRRIQKTLSDLNVNVEIVDKNIDT